MNALFIFSIIFWLIYSIFYNFVLLKIYFSLILLYILIVFFKIKFKFNDFSKKILISSGDKPGSPTIYLSYIWD